jgi:hypothetical protein
MSIRIFVEGNDDKNFIVGLLNPQFDFKDDRFQPLKDKLIDLFKGIK